MAEHIDMVGIGLHLLAVFGLVEGIVVTGWLVARTEYALQVFYAQG